MCSRDLFFRPACNNNAAICDVAPLVSGNAGFINEEDCVGAGYLAGHALGEASNFFGVRLAVDVLVFRLLHKMAVLHEFAGFGV